MYSVLGRGSFVTEESEFVVSRDLRRISQEGKYCKHPCLLIRGEIPSVNCHSSPFIILNLAGGWLVISDGGADKVTPEPTMHPSLRSAILTGLLTVNESSCSSDLSLKDVEKIDL